ncbi:hypothetical protein [Streptomyces sp. NPDC058572]
MSDTSDNAGRYRIEHDSMGKVKGGLDPRPIRRATNRYRWDGRPTRRLK